MILIIYLLLFYMILVNISYFSLRKYSRLYLLNKKQFIQSFVIFLSFIFCFLVFIKIMNLFREQKILDLKYYFFHFDLKIIILSIIMLYFIRLNLFFCVKINCYRLHYYFMNNKIKSNIFKPYYNNIFNIYFSSFVYYSYPILYYINIIFTTVNYSFILFDLLLNNFIMFNSLLIIPYYSFFKVIYNIIWYFECKHHALFEYFVREHNYVLILKNLNIGKDYDFPAVERSYLDYEKEVIRQL